MPVILCIDEPEVLSTRRLVLEKNGFEVRTARTGNEALKLLKDNVIQCAVVRHDPPVVNGLNAASEIRKNYPQIPIVLLSVTPPHSSFATDEYLSNLDGPEALIRAIKRAMGKRAHGRLADNIRRSLQLRGDFQELQNKTREAIHPGRKPRK